jgi:6-phosphogluconolactonase
MSDVEVRVEEDEEAAAAAVATLLAASGGNVVLTGGSTPQRAYELAAALRTDWSGVTFWWGDERCVPPEHADSNYGMARNALLARVDGYEERRIRGELPPGEAAAQYDHALRGEELQLLLLGIGPDGHTASLFPEAPTLDERERLVVPAPPGLEPWVERVTMTLPAIAAADEVVFLATGDGKADAVRRAFAEPPSAATTASLARGRRTVAVLDRAAASQL